MIHEPERMNPIAGRHRRRSGHWRQRRQSGRPWKIGS